MYRRLVYRLIRWLCRRYSYYPERPRKFRVTYYMDGVQYGPYYILDKDGRGENK